jgi:hypothetical protein
MTNAIFTHGKLHSLTHNEYGALCLYYIRDGRCELQAHKLISNVKAGILPVQSII